LLTFVMILWRRLVPGRIHFFLTLQFTSVSVRFLWQGRRKGKASCMAQSESHPFLTEKILEGGVRNIIYWRCGSTSRLVPGESHEFLKLEIFFSCCEDFVALVHQPVGTRKKPPFSHRENFGRVVWGFRGTVESHEFLTLEFFQLLWGFCGAGSVVPGGSHESLTLEHFSVAVRISWRRVVPAGRCQVGAIFLIFFVVRLGWYQARCHVFSHKNCQSFVWGFCGWSTSRAKATFFSQRKILRTLWGFRALWEFCGKGARVHQAKATNFRIFCRVVWGFVWTSRLESRRSHQFLTEKKMNGCCEDFVAMG
jgi:hypothetical protein